LKSALLTAYSSICFEKTSIASTNKKGDKESPRCNPFLPSKYPAKDPFNAMKNLEEVIHSLVQLMNLAGKPKQDRR
jgi:hypothetical protein